MFTLSCSSTSHRGNTTIHRVTPAVDESTGSRSGRSSSKAPRRSKKNHLLVHENGQSKISQAIMKAPRIPEGSSGLKLDRTPWTKERHERVAREMKERAEMVQRAWKKHNAVNSKGYDFLITDNSAEPIFKAGTVLHGTSEKPHVDGDVAIVLLNGGTAVVGHLNIIKHTYLISPLNPARSMMRVIKHNVLLVQPLVSAYFVEGGEEWTDFNIKWQGNAPRRA